ncbi:MAG TPA: hypothetical protein VFG59_11000 [Anaeromyxobacter sp.]|nr:hypothetical protein [Anaeromyxobacter sp.]
MPVAARGGRAAFACFLAACAALWTSCDVAYPEVVVSNYWGAHVLIRSPSFNGCVWNVTLAFGESTAPGQCLPGSDHVHFQKLDLDEEASDQGVPVWFNYETISVKSVGYGTFHEFDVESNDVEQDFSVPGPYGH